MKHIGTKTRLLNTLRWVIWIIPVLILFWVVERHYVISGHLELEYSVSEDSTSFMNFASKEPEVLTGLVDGSLSDEKFQLITRSPLYFDLRVPRPFPRATVRITYQNPKNLSPLRLGVKQAGEAYYYQDLALISPLLESLPDHWSMLREGTTVLWQKDRGYADEKQAKLEIAASRRRVIDSWREEEILKIALEAGERKRAGSDTIEEIRKYVESATAQVEKEYQDEVDTISAESQLVKSPKKTYDRIADFFDNLPDAQKVIQFNTQVSDRFTFDRLSSSRTGVEITTSLRGAHELYTYVGELDTPVFTFTLQDSNRDHGEDGVTVTLTDIRGKEILRQTYQDDGDTFASGVPANSITASLRPQDLPAGLYRININTSDDVLITNIQSTQEKLSFSKKIFIAESSEYHPVLGNGPFTATSLVTDSSTVSAVTRHQGGTQNITVESSNSQSELKIEKVKQIESLAELSGAVKLRIPNNDIEINGDGMFSFSASHLLRLSDYLLADLSSVGDVEKYDYIIAEYPVASQVGEWLVAEATIVAPHLRVDSQKDDLIHFIVDIPGLGVNGSTLKVKDVEVVLEKDPITPKKALEKLVNIFK